MKIRHKIMLLFILQVTAIILVLGLTVYYFSSLERKVVFDKRLNNRANYTAAVFSLLGDSSTAILDRLDSTSTAGLLPRRSVGIVDLKGKTLYQYNKTDSLFLHPDEVLMHQLEIGREVYFNLGKREAVAIKYHYPHKKFIVEIAAYDEEGHRRLAHLVGILFSSLFIGILLTALVAYLFSRQLLKPITQIIREVNEISSKNLQHRIRAGSGHDELNQLANTFNELLERLQKSFNIQRRFISNASHELSTPLTSISSQLQVTLNKERTTTEYKEVLLSVNEDVRQIKQLTKSLLEIARADTEGSIELSEMRIDEVLLKIISELKKLNKEYHIELNFGVIREEAMENDFVVFGNQELLHSAIKNVIENGCKYSPNKTAIVNLSYADKIIYISISNKGNTIAEGDLQKIFQPFYRGTNASEFKGFGLGLALSQSIIKLHKGSIEVKSGISNTTIFTVSLPSIEAFQI